MPRPTATAILQAMQKLNTIKVNTGLSDKEIATRLLLSLDRIKADVCEHSNCSSCNVPARCNTRPYYGFEIIELIDLHLEEVEHNMFEMPASKTKKAASV